MFLQTCILIQSKSNRFLLTGGLREAWLFMLISMLPEMVELAKVLFLFLFFIHYLYKLQITNTIT